MTQRLPDWPARFNAYLAAEKARPHNVRHHCLIFVAGGVRAVTGVDLSRGRRGSFTTTLGQRKHLKRLGFETVADLIESLFPSRLPTFARRGDVVMGDDGIPGLCIGDRAAFLGTDEQRDGIVTAPMSAMLRAWTVGEG